MECKHFSHLHNLTLYQTAQVAQNYCSGCHFPVSGGSVYVCQQCDFLLHGECFRASRSLNHPSHPSHPLTLVPSPTYPSASFFCDSCKVAGTGLSYTCSTCDFDLHVHCAYMSKNAASESSSQLPCLVSSTAKASSQADQVKLAGSIQHKSHPEHSLVFLSPPPYNFTCDACGESGNDCTYRCDTCNFDLHVKCATAPKTVVREDHEHPLSLYYKVQLTEGSSGFICDICNRSIPENLWTYYCRKCDFGSHLGCVKAAKEESLQAKLDDAIKMQQEITRMRWKMEMNNQIYQSMNNMISHMRL